MKIIADVKVPFDEYKVATNPHEVSADQLDTYTTSETEAILNQVLSGIPISRYGSLNYLPPGISGSFEGASVVTAVHYIPIVQEDDGTVVMLRTGTDGSTRGVYYNYCTLTEDGLIDKQFPTTTKYHPPGTPDGWSVVSAFGFGAGAMLILLLDESDGITVKYGLVKTNNTLDQTKHSYYEIDQTISQYISESTIAATTKFVVAGGRFATTGFVLFSQDTGSGHIRIITLGITDNNTTYLQIGSMTTTGFGDPIVSTGSSDDPLLIKPYLYNAVSQADVDNGTYQPGEYLFSYDATINGAHDVFHGPWRPQIVADPTNQSKFRLIVSSEIYFTAGLRSIWGSWAYTLEINFSTASATSTVISDISEQGRVIDNGTSLGLSGSVIISRTALDGGGNGNTYSTGFVTNKGFVYSATTTSSSVNRIAMLKTDASSAYDNMIVNDRNVIASSTTPLVQQYGSVVGGGLRNPVPFRNGKLMLLTDHGIGNYYVMCTLGDAGYTYPVYRNGSYPGYAPTADRVDVAPYSAYNCLISEVTEGGDVVVSGTHFCPGTNSALVDLGDTPDAEGYLSYAGTLTMTESDLDTLGQQALSASGLGYSLVDCDLKSSLFVTQRNAKMFLVTLVWYKPSSIAVALLSEITGSSNRTGDLTGLTYGRYVTKSGNIGNILYTSIARDQSVNPSHVYHNEAEGFSFIAISAPLRANYVGNGNTVSFNFIYDHTTEAIDDSTVLYGARWSYLQSGSIPYVYPDYGPGYSNGSIEITSGSTMLTIRPFGKTRAEVVARNAGTTYVTMSQKTVEGWVVYFTETTPIVMSGKYYELPPISFDLRNLFADPTNRTYRIYVQLDGNGPSYVISDVYVPESPTNMLIGTITTDDVQITGIESDKVTRFGNFRLGTTLNGSTIPVSTGSPTESATRPW